MLMCTIYFQANEEHKPVKCFHDGVYKIKWTAASKKFCTGQAEIERRAFLELKPDETASKETPTTLGPNERQRGSCAGT